MELVEEDYQKIGELGGRTFIRMMGAGEKVDKMMEIFVEEGFKQMGFKVPKKGSVVDILTLSQTGKIVAAVLKHNNLEELFPSNE